MTKNLTTSVQPALFETTAIRRVMHNGEWHWSITDIIDALTGSNNVRRYWTELKKKLKAEGAIQLLDKIEQLKLVAPDGKARKTDAGNLETCFRIIQSIPSHKAEPFKEWLSQVAVERLKEEADPGLAIDRAVKKYRASGWSQDRIRKRIDGILKRNMLTETWASRGIKKFYHYANLTNLQYKIAFRLDKNQLVRHFDQKPKSNPREVMPDIALVLIDLYETVTRDMTEASNAFGYARCAEIATEAAQMARQTVENIERMTGKPILPPPAQKKLKV